MKAPEGRREQILSAAVEIAYEEGIRAVSVRAVAARVGIGASTLRHYFPAQAELLSATSRAIFDSQVHDFRIEDATVEPTARLVECFWQFLAPFEGAHAALEAWFETHRQALSPDTDPSVATFLTEAHRAGQASARRWLETIAGQGHLAASAVDAATTTLLALVDGLALHMLVDPDRVEEKAAKEALTFAIASMLSRHGEPDPAQEENS